MQKTCIRPREGFAKVVRKFKGTMKDAPELCSFTLEPCLLQADSVTSPEVPCPFTLEQVCICRRALPANWN